MWVLILMAAIWGWVAYVQMQRQREQAHREVLEARRDWQNAIGALTPRLEEQSEKLNEVIAGLNRWQEDRKKLGLTGAWEMRAEAVIKGNPTDRERLREQIASVRQGLETGFSSLRNLFERPSDQSAPESGEEGPAQPE